MAAYQMDLLNFIHLQERANNIGNALVDNVINIYDNRDPFTLFPHLHEGGEVNIFTPITRGQSRNTKQRKVRERGKWLRYGAARKLYDVNGVHIGDRNLYKFHFSIRPIERLLGLHGTFFCKEYKMATYFNVAYCVLTRRPEPMRDAAWVARAGMRLPLGANAAPPAQEVPNEAPPVEEVSSEGAGAAPVEELANGAVRVLNINTALRSLLKGLAQCIFFQWVMDLVFFADDLQLWASASVDGRVYVFTEGCDEEDRPQIAGRIVTAIQIIGEGESVHPRVCWHCQKQEVLVVGIRRRVLKIDTTPMVFASVDGMVHGKETLLCGVSI